MKQKIGIIGHGTVGKALYEQISNLQEFEVVGVAVKHPDKHRNLPAAILSGSPQKFIDDPKVEIVLEAIDDADAALEFAKSTLSQGKVYISASKKMIANNLATLELLTKRHGGRFLCEASVGGAIPVLRTIREHLSAEPISRMRGIVNGSCNYILTRMELEKIDFDTALAEAQAKGFAETDPSSDIDAWDSYYKALILAYTAFGDKPDVSRIKWEGIRNVTLRDIEDASRGSERIKLVAEVQRQDERFIIDIRPTRVKADDPLYHVNFENNGIIIYGKYTGPLLLQGAGAGGNPTASAMIGDLRQAGIARLEQVRKLLLTIN